MNEPGYYIAPDNLLLILAITGAMAVLTMAEATALWRVQHLARQMDRRRWFAVVPFFAGLILAAHAAATHVFYFTLVNDPLYTAATFDSYSAGPTIFAKIDRS